ncbi:MULTISPECIES: hypothetical protein [unclassified Pseudomonas]|uniref:hypothetical protein n=1 Tax=unclassified Pseudomonas TaxID=196821 RepID=UPI0013031989|nr:MULTISPECIES: hypothetical protein [unclassified Pseudomonas]NWB61041.1 hypothetical protein [Pseudomonas sp. F1002]
MAGDETDLARVSKSRLILRFLHVVIGTLLYLGTIATGTPHTFGLFSPERYGDCRDDDQVNVEPENGGDES